MNITIVLGFALGALAIAFGHLAEGGNLGSLIQLTAAVIVFGGTIGAVLVSHPMSQIRLAIDLFRQTWKTDGRTLGLELARDIVEAAIVARKESILALDRRLTDFRDPYMRSVFRYVVDGIDPRTIEEIFRREIEIDEKRLLSASRVFMDAGGFSPTIGIIGAVLGLIHVMENLTDTSKLGAGIAVAFVATVYGVGGANLIFIPIANRIKGHVADIIRNKELVLTGALGVVNGLNPIIIEEMLRPFYGESPQRGNAR